MTDETTGLTADNIGRSVRNPERSGYTSPTNIGGYLWSTIVVRDLGLISRDEAHRRLSQTLRTLGRLDRHRPSGMFFNWYDERTGAVLHTWPSDGGPVYPFLSSVDNGWLAAALIVVSNAGDSRVAQLAEQLLKPMNFKAYYDPSPPGKPPGGLLRGGFWPEKPPTPSDTVEGNYLGVGPNVFYTGFWYDTAVSEARIASYIGIARGQLPPVHYFAKWRTFPASCDWSWQEQQPVGTTRNYLGVDVFEGAYTYRGMRIVPGWGGSMFEALMPDIFVPEARWAPRSWGLNHPLTVRAHREHGLDDAKYGYWGFSPSSDPAVVNGYREFGVDAIGLNPDGYFSDEEKTAYDPTVRDMSAGNGSEPDLPGRRRDPTRVLPGHAARGAPRIRQSGEDRGRIGGVWRRRLLRCGRGPLRQDLRALSLVGSGDDLGSHRQRVRRRHRPEGVLRRYDPASDPASHRHGAVLGRCRRLMEPDLAAE